MKLQGAMKMSRLCINFNLQLIYSTLNQSHSLVLMKNNETVQCTDDISVSFLSFEKKTLSVKTTFFLIICHIDLLFYCISDVHYIRHNLKIGNTKIEHKCFDCRSDTRVSKIRSVIKIFDKDYNTIFIFNKAH